MPHQLHNYQSTRGLPRSKTYISLIKFKKLNSLSAICSRQMFFYREQIKIMSKINLKKNIKERWTRQKGIVKKK